MKPSALLLLSAGFLFAGTDLSRADESLNSFPIGSRWSTENLHGGLVTAGGRAGDVIGLEGTGSGISAEGGKAVLWHRTGDQFSRTITARLLSLEGANGAGEAGVWLHSRDPRFGDVGMRLFYSGDGSLRWEAAVYTEPPSSGGPITGLVLPLWLRVKFYQGGLQGYYSPNGSEWTALAPGPLPVTLPPNATPGLVVSSQGHAAPSRTRFDNVAIVDGDADENAILDGWEIENFQRLLGAEANADSDGDGATNFEEWLWGTEPRRADGKPVLRIEPIGNGSVRISLAGNPFHQTRRFETSTTMSGPWAVAPADTDVPFSSLRLTVPLAGEARFFRVVSTGSPYDDPSPGGAGF